MIFVLKSSESITTKREHEFSHRDAPNLSKRLTSRLENQTVPACCAGLVAA